jgi:hypothetical protein
MIAVAVVGLLVGVPLHWANWLRHNPIPLSGRVQARLQPVSNTYVAGRTIPVEIAYDVKLSAPGPPAGMFFRLMIEASVEDRATGVVIDRYTFHRHLIAGVRDESSGTIPWQIRHPRPGVYYLKHKVAYMEPLGTWEQMMGGASSYAVRSPVPGDRLPPK